MHVIYAHQITSITLHELNKKQWIYNDIRCWLGWNSQKQRSLKFWLTVEIKNYKLYQYLHISIYG